MQRTRNDKYEDFQKFLEDSETLFKELMKDDEDCDYFDRQYKLYIVPGGWNGGIDKRVLEIFYGARPYDAYDSRPAIDQGKEIGDKAPKQMGFYVERGARLVYGRTAKGNVNCTLIPATAEGEKTPENAIQLESGIDPRDLLQREILRRHWRYFMSYMKVTCLDGEPSFQDGMRVYWMRLIKKRFKEGSDVPPQLFIWFGHVAKWTFTVGLSGLLLNVVTRNEKPQPIHFDSPTTHAIETILEKEQQLANELSITNKSISELNVSINSSEEMIKHKNRFRNASIRGREKTTSLQQNPKTTTYK